MNIFGYGSSQGDSISVQLVSGEDVLAEAGNATVESDTCGSRWSVTMDTPVSSDELMLVFTVNGQEVQRSKDVRLGHVIVCDGQSNMAWTVRDQEDHLADSTLQTQHVRSYWTQQSTYDSLGADLSPMTNIPLKSECDTPTSWNVPQAPDNLPAVCFFAASAMIAPDNPIHVGIVVTTVWGQSLYCFAQAECLEAQKHIKGLTAMGVSLYQGESDAAADSDPSAYGMLLQQYVSGVFQTNLHPPDPSMGQIPVAIVKLPPMVADTDTVKWSAENWETVRSAQAQVASSGGNIALVDMDSDYSGYTDRNPHVQHGKKRIGEKITHAIYGMYN